MAGPFVMRLFDVERASTFSLSQLTTIRSLLVPQNSAEGVRNQTQRVGATGSPTARYFKTGIFEHPVRLMQARNVCAWSSPLVHHTLYGPEETDANTPARRA